MDMHMPQPGPEHETLARFTGEWIGEETMYPSPWSPEERNCSGHILARMLDGWYAISEYEQRCGDEVTFRGHGVYSFDQATKEYLMYWFDTMGGPGGVARGKLEGNQLTFLNENPMGRGRYRYTFDDGETLFEMSMSPDGENWQDMMRAIYRPADRALRDA